MSKPQRQIHHGDTENTEKPIKISCALSLIREFEPETVKRFPCLCGPVVKSPSIAPQGFVIYDFYFILRAVIAEAGRRLS